ncbi:UNVERIFIED_CONTAM: hypothetical protein HDU68_010106 [Siphonaria sp. JEL0065]|nr:hypothetical protein HDU68_010106 [Siphonaria sp. JEL0065]
MPTDPGNTCTDTCSHCFDAYSNCGISRDNCDFKCDGSCTPHAYEITLTCATDYSSSNSCQLACSRCQSASGLQVQTKLTACDEVIGTAICSTYSRANVFEGNRTILLKDLNWANLPLVPSGTTFTPITTTTTTITSTADVASSTTAAPIASTQASATTSAAVTTTSYTSVSQIKGSQSGASELTGAFALVMVLIHVLF